MPPPLRRGAEGEVAKDGQHARRGERGWLMALIAGLEDEPGIVEILAWTCRDAGWEWRLLHGARPGELQAGDTGHRARRGRRCRRLCPQAVPREWRAGGTPARDRGGESGSLCHHEASGTVVRESEANPLQTRTPREYPDVRTCEVHGESLVEGESPVIYGFQRETAERLEASTRFFPHAASSVPGGCLIASGQPTSERVRFCQACRLASRPPGLACGRACGPGSSALSDSARCETGTVAVRCRRSTYTNARSSGAGHHINRGEFTSGVMRERTRCADSSWCAQCVSGVGSVRPDQCLFWVDSCGTQDASLAAVRRGGKHDQESRTAAH